MHNAQENVNGGIKIQFSSYQTSGNDVDILLYCTESRSLAVHR